MIYLSLVAALAVGYTIGLMQNGIRVYRDNPHDFKEGDYNQSIGTSDFTDYYDKHVHLNGEKGE